MMLIDDQIKFYLLGTILLFLLHWTLVPDCLTGKVGTFLWPSESRFPKEPKGGSVIDVNKLFCFLWTPCIVDADIIFMAAVCNRAGHYIFAVWFLSFFFFSLA